MIQTTSTPPPTGRRRVAGLACIGALTCLILSAGCSERSAGRSNPQAERPSASNSQGGDGDGIADRPPGDWTTVDPEAVGFDSAALESMAAEAEKGNSYCLLVARHGRIAGEWYFNGVGPDDPQEVYSATKSYTSVLTGIAQDEGALDIDDSASDYIPQWKGTPAEQVTIKHLLSNDSGRHWDFATDYQKMAVYERDKTALAISLAQDNPPGKVWVYNNSAIQTLEQVLETATGRDVATFAQDKLLAPLGMDHSEMTHDGAGNTLTFMGLRSTCRDMARFGEMLLDHGTWEGKKIVSSRYLAEATGAASTPLNSAYGYLFWLNRKGYVANPATPTRAEAGGGGEDRQMVDGAPEDIYWALGLGNQSLTVFPGLDALTVRIGPGGIGRDPDAFTNEKATRLTLAALGQG